MCILFQEILRVESIPSVFKKILSHKYIKLISLVSILFLLFITYRLYIWANTQSTDNAYIEANISSISAEVGGIIERVLIEENNFVQEGQIIAQINSVEYKAKYEQAEAKLNEAIHSIKMIEQNIKLGIIKQNKAKEAYEFAKKNFKVVEANYKRTTKLSEDNYASQKSLDDTKIVYKKLKVIYFKPN